nr:hypothetical protein [Bacteroidota bacterium]
VTIILTGYSINPCTATGNDIAVFTITREPFVDANDPDTICQGNFAYLTGFASDYSATNWFTDEGDGYFTNTSSLSTNYVPGPYDIVAGEVKVKLEAFPKNPCSSIALDSTIIPIKNFPFVNAGVDMTTCENQMVELEGSVQNASAFLWESSGDGAFVSDNFLAPYYLPGSQDILNGKVTLCLEAFSTVCEPMSDCIEVTIISLPEVFAGEDATVPIGEAYTITDAVADSCESVMWNTSNGTGLLSNQNTVHATYTPSNDDYPLGTIYLSLTGFPKSPCSVSAIDEIEIMVSPNCNEASAYAGADITICEGQTFSFNNATADNYSSLEWTTIGGDGQFSNTTILNPEYTPGANDLANGSVTLCLSAKAFSVCSDANDCMTLSFQAQPEVDAGNDETLCSGENLILSGYSENFAIVTWTSTGDGTFDNINNLETTYYPCNNDWTSGSTQLCLTATGISGCENVADCINLTLHEAPTVSAGINATICETATLPLNGQGDNFETVQWNTNGDGFFINGQSLSAAYSPGQNDITAGGVELCLTAFGLESCTESQDCIQISINPIPEVYAGVNGTICGNGSFITAGTADNYTALEWGTTGDGTFANASHLSTNYYPGGNDIQSGTVQLCLTANALEGCTDMNDCVELTIIPAPYAFAGNDQTTCESNVVQLTGLASDYNTISWASLGDGSFINPGNLNATYIPGSNDIVNGFSKLVLTATGQLNCDDKSDTLKVNFQQLPSVSAGNNITVCETEESISINGFAENYQNPLWNTVNGDGYFSENSALNTNYYPGTNDYINGSVELCLDIDGLYGCPGTTDCKTIYFQEAPLVDAGNDQTICNNQNIELSADVQYTTSFEWASAGDGYFSDINALNSIYYPGTQDIQTGNVVLQIAAHGTFGCADEIDAISIQIQKEPFAEAGYDATINQGETYLTENAIATNYSGIIWATSGSGIFDDPSAVNTEYIPSLEDISAGGVTLEITTNPVDPCQAISNDNLLLSILLTSCLNAEANAGNDATACEGESFQISATASNYASLYWQSSGDGTFSNPLILLPDYTPGTNDMLNGSVELCLTAYANDTCQDATDCMVL